MEHSYTLEIYEDLIEFNNSNNISNPWYWLYINLW
jgi:hypothetical protein